MPQIRSNETSTLLDLLENSVCSFSSKTLFQTDHFTITYCEFYNQVRALSTFLSRFDRELVLVKSTNPINIAIAFFSIVLTNNIALLLDPSDEKLHLCYHNIRLILDDPTIEHHLNGGVQHYISEFPNISTQDVCVIIHSSGTSGSSKGIMLSQKNICSNAISGLENYAAEAGERIINAIPYYHAFGLTAGLLAPIISGLTICVLPHPTFFFQSLKSYKPTMVNAPPALATILLDLIDSGMSNSNIGIDSITGGKLKKILCGGAPLDIETIVSFQEYGINVYGSYGLTECSPCVTINGEKYNKIGSSGFPLSCNKVLIASDGEILVSGDNVMVGYFEDDILTKTVVYDGILHTGDLGYVDSDGYLYVTGRKKNLIIFEDGRKCVPESIEKEIMHIPGVKEALVKSIIISKRTYLIISVYMDNNCCNKSNVELDIRMICSNYPIYTVEIRKKPFSKTLSGKIIRD